MFFEIRLRAIAILLTIYHVGCEISTSSTETADVATRSSNVSDYNSTNSDEQDWRLNDSSEYPRAGENIVSIDVASLHKRRRDGIENLPENDYRRRYFLDYPERYEYENELYHRDKPRYQDEVYPVRIQGCSHMMRDVSRLQSDTGNRGILEGWLGGSSWRENSGNNDDDKRYDSAPLHVTTATPKVVPSYRNRDYGKYDYGYEKDNKNSNPFKSSYESDQKISRGEYFNTKYRDGDRNASPWMTLPQHNRNNRIVYYEYNLDDRRADSKFRGWDRNCGTSGLLCEQDWHTGSMRNDRNRVESGYRYSSRNEYPRTNTMSFSRNNDEMGEIPFSNGYRNEDSYRYRNGRNEGQQNPAGFGYVYSLDLPSETRRFSSPSSAFAADLILARSGQESGYRRPRPHVISQFES